MPEVSEINLLKINSDKNPLIIPVVAKIGKAGANTPAKTPKSFFPILFFSSFGSILGSSFKINSVFSPKTTIKSFPYSIKLIISS